MMCLGGFTSRAQIAMNLLGMVASCAMFLALPNLRGILLPPPAPVAVAPSSPSPYYLWVSLNTPHPESFRVVLESRYWSNRRAEVSLHSEAPASTRAEIRLHQLTVPGTDDSVDGTIWIERHYRFLTREFGPGESVGRYSLSYINSLGYE